MYDSDPHTIRMLVGERQAEMRRQAHRHRVGRTGTRSAGTRSAVTSRFPARKAGARSIGRVWETVRDGFAAIAHIRRAPRRAH
ncbi:MAG: hypothetical protein QNJ12_03255 [Ilumatobacter sp.]|uniref:hypothetical protein n=1 Tax=Ilumatobacter sp. TaxID=1967498 RepID=UPI002601D796|nr:hypothetical protein [Ilumatobacter sp.]MDJ0767778.1 hypothetical protein [Ilumatobacter sp.]